MFPVLHSSRCAESLQVSILGQFDTEPTRGLSLVVSTYVFVFHDVATLTPNSYLVKFSTCTPRSMCTIGGMPPLILYLCITWRWVIRFRARRLTPGNELRYPLIRFGLSPDTCLDGLGKRKTFCDRRDSNYYCLVVQPV